MNHKSVVRRSQSLVAFLAWILLCAAAAEARVVRFTVLNRERPAFGGKQSGTAGQYEILTGRFHGELDPRSPLNAIITDIELAPKTSRGSVEYSATFTIAKPVDSSRSSGVLWYEVPNRGNSPLNPRPSEDGMAAGHILVSSGWQGDITPKAGIETITVPIARNVDGTSITGPVFYRIMGVSGSTASLTGGYGGLRYQFPVTLDTSKAMLTRQASNDGQAIPLPPSDWAFASCKDRPFPGEPDPSSVCVKNGFDPEYLYEVRFTAKDPMVLGIGFAATRDIISFLSHETKDSDGNANPVAGAVRHAIGFGNSQSGNFLKTFIHLGFNQDEAGLIVFHGANPNIAGRQLAMNIRFAVPGGAAETYQAGSEGVLWWGTYKDEAQGRPAASLLDRCRAAQTCPKIFETFGSAEFWGLRMSPGLVGTKADADIPLPPEVRRYYFPSVTHGGGRGGFEVIDTGTPGSGCTLPNNPNSTAEVMRALRRALTDWVVRNAPPPDSRFPTLAAGQLVPPAAIPMGFPAIPGAPLPDNLINQLPNHDFGSLFRYSDLSGVFTLNPPAIRGSIPLLVPRTDTDGNEVGGIPTIWLQVPLGTYLGWNVTASGYMKGRICGFAGGFIPFARTREQRLASGDPRPSLEERYGTPDAFAARVREAARLLVEQKFLLPEDADRLVKEAGQVQFLAK